MWYREGTNSFEKESKKVKGVGTSWSQAKYGVMPGMVLIGSDNLLYEIESIQSDTELTLVEAYKGGSIKDQPCRIITTYEGDLSQFSARFSALLQSISTDSREIRRWLTSPSPVVIIRDDGTKFTADSLETIYAAHKTRVEWFDKNRALITDAGNQAANAASSAKAAKESQTAAQASEAKATNSAKAAKDSQVAASSSQSSAKISENNAKTSEINAANSAKAAASSQIAAKTSETNTANAAKEANASQSAAKISETNAANFAKEAKLAELASKTSETNAKSFEVGAKSSEVNAKASENSAIEKAKQASGSQIAAKASETNAASFKEASAKSASNASLSASKAEQEANKAIGAATSAATSESNALISAKSAKTSESNAKLSETNAAISEKNAKVSEVNVAASKSAAENSAKDAANTLAKMGNDAKVADNAAKAAKLSETNSKASETATKASEANVLNAVKAAKSSQDAAKASETNATHSAQLASTSQASAKASEGVAVSSKNVAQEAATLATKKAKLAAASESKALDAANRATLAAQTKEDLLKGKTVVISTGSDVATWTKIATVIMPQGASTVRIEIVGGSGFNVGQYSQTAMSEIVLRSGNGYPKGINASLYRTNNGAANKVATINTKDDEYDVYIHFHGFPFDLICNVQQANATVLNVGKLSTPLETLPEGVLEGKTYNYVLASAVDEHGNLSIDTNLYGPGFVSGARGKDRTWIEPKNGEACWLANLGDRYVGEFKHPKKSGTAAILEEHYTKGESDGKYALKNSKEALTAGILYVNSGNQFPGLVLQKPDKRYAVIETTPHGGAPLNFIYREPNGSNISVASLPTETGVIALQGYSYSKAEADGKYQPKGNYSVVGSSYTKDETNQNFVKSDTTNLGKSRTALKTIQSGGWAQPIGYSTMVHINSAKLPNGFGDHAYWHVIAARDMAQGYAGFLTGFNNGRIYYGFSNTKESDPTWVKVYTENHKPSPSELDVYSKGESDGKYQPKGDYAINQNTVPNGRKINGKLLSSDITLNAADVGAFHKGLTETVSNDNVPWNAASGVYNANYGGHTQIIVHFNMGTSGFSTPSLQLKSIYKNNGIAYRSARDGYGFEEPWTEFYTTKNKPSASDLGAYTKDESDSRNYSSLSYVIRKSGGDNFDLNNWPNNRVAFVYHDAANSAQETGVGASFALNSNYVLQLVSRYHGNGEVLKFRTKNGDNNTWNAWHQVATTSWTYSQGDIDAKINGRMANGVAYTKGESDGKYALKNSQEELKVGYISAKWVNDYAGIKLQKPDNRYALIETTPHGSAPLNFIYREANGNNISVASLPTGSGVLAFQDHSYSKAEADGKYQLKGNFANKGESYTKGESDSRYFEKSGNLSLTGAFRRHIIFNNGSKIDGYIFKDPDGHLMFNNGVHGGDWQMKTDGSFYCGGNGNFNDVYIRSDKRAKKDIAKIGDASQKLSKLSGYTYTVSDDNNNSSRSAGLIAQEVQKILPEAVTKDENGLLRLNYNSVMGLLVESVKDLQKQVDALKNNR
ncbi:tail fiber domain-containing protein [Xenorhabdus sp. PR6a]|uniref:tail fiber domain-containing protein n=1 Tax=Xenorhabdus sp. PR6a TaxID=3025877 RepID=UPI0023598BFC|nr:tail fiber domain-containing protein [Xenorhabdus sp. PR6a]MDC9582360.1 tail fiber domain-containing protein [Xenorhabdus sp. PR6a]